MSFMLCFGWCRAGHVAPTCDLDGERICVTCRTEHAPPEDDGNAETIRLVDPVFAAELAAAHEVER